MADHRLYRRAALHLAADRAGGAMRRNLRK
jgi:hypothetical protein